MEIQGVLNLFDILAADISTSLYVGCVSKTARLECRSIND